ncbi:MAG: PD-(D/E)XK nuclease family protein [Methylococcus sp.]|nr:PD-(D/E)XK nuclease family protein [Methylococcus sp.]
MAIQEENFLAQVVTFLPFLRETETQLNRELGRGFNAFNLFNIDENASSRILAFLLNPCEKHGQGNTFLRSFLSAFISTWERLPLDNVAIYVEYYTNGGRRMDVLINIDGKYYIGIENKFKGASDQQNQVLDYLQELKRKANNDPDRYRLIFLGQKGKKAGESSFPKADREKYKEQIINGSWLPSEDEGEATAPDVSAWLETAIKDCRAENVRWFLKQFASYIKQEIEGEKVSQMCNNALIKYAMTTPENVDAALRIAECGESLKENIRKKFLEEVLGRMEELAKTLGGDWEVRHEWPGGDWTTTTTMRHLPILLRKKDWPSMAGIAIQAGSTGPKDVQVGVMAPTYQVWQNTIKNIEWRETNYGKQQTFAGLESRKKILTGLEQGEDGGGWWIYSHTIEPKDMVNIDAIIEIHGERSIIIIDDIIGKMHGMGTMLRDLEINEF